MDKKRLFAAELGDLKYRTDVPARCYTSFRIGGAMAFFAEPCNLDELCALLSTAKRCDYPVHILGNGSNTLISDKGVDALFIRIGEKMASYSVDDGVITADAGALLCTIAKESVRSGLMGLEWGAGIPGTVGGGVAMNAGAYGGEMKQVLRTVTHIRNGEVFTSVVRDGDLGYRYSAFAYPSSVIVRVSMSFRPDDGLSKERLQEYSRKRRENQPLDYPSAGSTFKRPVGHYAGALIEAAGLKGARIGNAMVSRKHAGFIINCGGATFDDVVSLIDHVRNIVYRQSGVLLEPEVRIIR